jgi:hypothetical protein
MNFVGSINNYLRERFDVRRKWLKHFHHLRVLCVFVVKVCFFAAEIMDKWRSRTGEFFCKLDELARVRGLVYAADSKQLQLPAILF